MGDANDATVHGPTAPVTAEAGNAAEDRLGPDPSDDNEPIDPEQIDAAATAAQISPLGDEVMSLLAEHIPLALLVDLAAAPSDRASTEILRAEGLPDEAWWEQPEGDSHPAASGLPEESADEGSRKFTSA
ncbi:hypothetical protein [Pengzhenrongella sicca]|uniref:Uncharacterized protein n=1 Tax=Pengzhenrongella sicca TaxID=2819238 RepID=A0A8A4ZIS1_9MICO|nr:hypothetical protein [Pengzhenrongella sicca]QTE30417.1 hypothetical protein J4E96_05340 [Pengzhenrongella sicca]